MPANTDVTLVNPTAVNSTVGKQPSRRKANAEYRTREHLTQAEVDTLIATAKANRWGHRDSTMVLMAYRHGLRAAELVNLKWDQVSFEAATLYVVRVKGSRPSEHPLQGDELRALRRLKREQGSSEFVFTSERGAPFSPAGFAAMVRRAGEASGLRLKVHAHMLRHGCGHVLANKGVDTRSLQAYLGHVNIQHTVRYTEIAAKRFKGFWD